MKGKEYVVWAAYGSFLQEERAAFDWRTRGIFKLGDGVDLPAVVATTYCPVRELLPTAYKRCLSEGEDAQMAAAFVRARPEDVE